MSRTVANNAVMQIMLGTLLPIQRKESQQKGADDFQYMQGKSNLDRYIRILNRAHGSLEFERSRQARLTNLKVLLALA